MKALSLTQPWATLVKLGAKKIETRSWATNYRGPVAIHAAKGFPGWARDLANCRLFQQKLGGQSAGMLPRGVVLATAELMDCKKITLEVFRIVDPGSFEYAAGDYTPGRYAWFLENVKPLAEPVPAKGALGFWEWACPAI